MTIEQTMQDIVPIARKDLEAIIAYLIKRPWEEVAHLLKVNPPQDIAPENNTNAPPLTDNDANSSPT